jgi:topoisomerase-4 subunit B
LEDYLQDLLNNKTVVTKDFFSGSMKLADDLGSIEWAMAWLENEEGEASFYANTISTPLGGTHESGFKSGLIRAIKEYSKLTGNKQMAQITSEDIIASATFIVSAFVKNPIFQGQTKDKLLSQEVSRPIENVIKAAFEDWLTHHPKQAELIVQKILEDTNDRLSRKKSKEVNRKTAIKGLRLPGKLADCANNDRKGTELFLVEGESAGGSAKQARDRNTQAVLPLKGKILNVESSTKDKILNNAEIRDLISALGTGIGKNYKNEDLRYEKVIIMTDADVDGMHITSLLLTFFFKQMPQLVENGHLYLAQPPLYRLTHKNKTYYAADDADLEKFKKQFEGKGHIEIGRFKGLGEMTAPQLKETTMTVKNRKILQLNIDNKEHANDIVTKLMGKDPEARFNFIKARSANDEEKELLI